jgi:hypothetical protein
MFDIVMRAGRFPGILMGRPCEAVHMRRTTMPKYYNKAKATKGEWDNIKVETLQSPEILKLLENYRTARDKLAASKLVEAEEAAKNAIKAFFSAKRGYPVNVNLAWIDRPRTSAESGPTVGLIRAGKTFTALDLSNEEIF